MYRNSERHLHKGPNFTASRITQPSPGFTLGVWNSLAQKLEADGSFLVDAP